MRNLMMARPRLLALASIFVAMANTCLAQQVFSSPQEAAQALVNAARHPGEGLLEKIFGPGSKELFSSGDDAVDSQRVADFLVLAGKGNSVEPAAGGLVTLVFGDEGWRFPVPLQGKGAEWRFDLAAGRQEVLNRTIGRNELTVVGVCADYVAAQREYYASLHDDEPVQQYAQRFISSPDRHDGLWWEAANQADRSPLGDEIAAAAVEKAQANSGPSPYGGYIYRILRGQGPKAPGGAYSYVVAGRMLAGFAMVAYPSRWGETGVMTFLCDQQGQVYQRNLGPKTGADASQIDSFDPGDGWDKLKS
jgi:Protein of unknown function (DUF2950)